MTDKPLPDTVARWKDGERPHYYDNFLRMSPAERKWHSDKDRAIWEVKRRNADRPITPSYFLPEGGLDAALRRFGFDPYGNDNPLQQVYFQEPSKDERSRNEIMAEAGANFRAFVQHACSKTISTEVPPF